MRTLLLLAATALLVGCHDATAPMSKATDIWDGRDQFAEVHLALEMRGDSVSGFGTIQLAGWARPAAVTVARGRFAPPSVEIEFSSSDGPFYLSSMTATAAELPATIGGSALFDSAISITLRRR